MLRTMETSAAIEADGVVLHVGSHQGAGFEAGMERVVPALEQILERTSDTTWLLMENTAGAGGTIGRSVDELEAIFERLGRHPPPRHLSGLVPPLRVRDCDVTDRGRARPAARRDRLDVRARPGPGAARERLEDAARLEPRPARQHPRRRDGREARRLPRPPRPAGPTGRPRGPRAGRPRPRRRPRSRSSASCTPVGFDTGETAGFLREPPSPCGRVSSRLSYARAKPGPRRDWTRMAPGFGRDSGHPGQAPCPKP